MKIFNNWFILILVVFFTLFFYGVYGGVEISSEQYDKCKSKGGVPMTERGIYKACMKEEAIREMVYWYVERLEK